MGVGLNATDTLISVPHHPERGSKLESPSVSVLPGGQVASAVVACQHWGLRTRYVGKLGDDPAAALHQQEFARAGVNTEIVTARGCASHQSFILVDASGERTVIRRHDETLVLHPAELKRDWISSARSLLVDGCDTAAATTAAEWAREAHIPVIADFDEAYPCIERLMKNVDYLIVSRDFPQMVCGESDLKNSLPLLQRVVKDQDGIRARQRGTEFYGRTRRGIAAPGLSGRGSSNMSAQLRRGPAPVSLRNKCRTRTMPNRDG